jgi:hypothetical protein
VSRAHPILPPLFAGISAVCLLSVHVGVGHASDLYTELPRELIGYDSSKEIHIHSPAEADTLRRSVVHYLWGSAGLPVTKLPTCKAVYSGNGALPADVAGLRAANIARIERLQANMDFRYGTAAYVLHPANARIIPRLVIVSHGHADYDSRFNAGIGPLINHLLENGATVLAVQMPLYGWNRQQNLQLPSGAVTVHDHNEMVRALEGKGGSALRFFVEPVVQGVNHFVHANPHSADVSMVGLSGGGWTTVLAAAVDPRIKLSIAVSGSMPIYARRFYPGSIGDAEQMLPALYRDRASYLDLYALDACGKGRRHIQIGNQYDSGCFYGVSHSTWVANVKKAVNSTGAGAYDFYLDSTHRQHQISPHAVEKVIDPALGIQRRKETTQK